MHGRNAVNNSWSLELVKYLIVSPSNLALAKLYFLSLLPTYHQNMIYRFVYIAYHVIWNNIKNVIANLTVFSVCLLRKIKNINSFWNESRYLKLNVLKEIALKILKALKFFLKYFSLFFIVLLMRISWIITTFITT